jgi:hypothetical protein
MALTTHLPSSADAKERVSYTSASPLGLRGLSRATFTFTIFGAIPSRVWAVG